MLLRISHETRFTYSAPVSETVFEVRMGSATDEDQTTLGYRLRTNPQAPVTSYRDGLGNRVDLFNIAKPYHELVIHATSYVRTHRRPGPPRLEGPVPSLDGPAAIELLEFLQPSPQIPESRELDGFVAELRRPSEAGSMRELVEHLMDAVHSRLKFESQVTKSRTKVHEALELGRGVCQDFAHLFLGACRGLGLPARYVSGYVNHPGELATHAWCQVWGGEKAGWVDVDPTTRKFVGDNHVVIATGRDYSDVPPNRGLWKGKAEETIAVTVKVEPVDRVPMEWNDWGLTSARQPHGMSQSQRMGGMSQSQRSTRYAYPDQRGHYAGLHQQQGEQQQ